MIMGNIQVCVENVTKHFGEVLAVDHLSLSVEQGQFLTLLGPSGCGKTTLLRSIAGFEEPDSGRIAIGGRDVTDLPAHKRPANMVFQRYALFPHLTVFENVAFGLRVKKLSAKEIETRVLGMLALVQLEGYGERRINQLSGGQAQRVALARALVNEPGVLLLDEPLGALDLKIRYQMEMELKLLHAKLGITFIYVTHDQDEAMTLSDRVVIMSAGRVVQDSTPEDVYRNPASAFVADFIGHSNLIEAEVEKVDPLRLVFFGRSYATRCCAGLSAGQKVKALLRPEAMQLFREKPDGYENWVGGSVLDVTFKGAYVDYLVDTGAYRLKVHQSLYEGVTVLGRGEHVHLAWCAEDVIVLSA
jgi:spermidine/putrescine transport system ATP-binding protein